MRSSALSLFAVLVVGCGEIAKEAAPIPVTAAQPAPDTPQDIYIREATVLEHMQTEYDRRGHAAREHMRTADERWKAAQEWDRLGNKEKVDKHRSMSEQYEGFADQANREAAAKYPAILSQQQRVDDAKAALGL